MNKALEQTVCVGILAGKARVLRLTEFWIYKHCGGCGKLSDLKRKHIFTEMKSNTSGFIPEAMFTDWVYFW